MGEIRNKVPRHGFSLRRVNTIPISPITELDLLFDFSFVLLSLANNMSNCANLTMNCISLGFRWLVEQTAKTCSGTLSK